MIVFPPIPGTGLVSELLTPLAVSYTDDLVLERSRKLLELYAAADDDPQLAARLAALVAKRFWAWLALVAWTKDEKAPKIRVKPFSPLECYQRLADWAEERTPEGTWKRPLLAIDKSRQLMMSWWCVHRLYWLCHATPYTYCPILSKNEDDAAVMLERMHVFHALLPNWLKRARGLHATKLKVGSIKFNNGSIVEAMPQKGGQAARSRVPSMWMADEAAFQDDFEKNFMALKGTSDDRTQGLMITTAQPSFFQQLIEDTQDGRRGRPELEHESTGLKLWLNGKNRIYCGRIHYTADPARRSAEWKAAAMRGMSLYQWQQEHEINYAARGGRPVFPMLDREIHMMAGRAEVLQIGPRQWGLRVQGYIDERTGEPIVRPVKLMRAIDHGTTNWCAAVWIAVDDDFDWTVYRVYRRTGWRVQANGQEIMRLSGQWDRDQTPEHYAFDLIDAMTGLPDAQGKYEDLYRALVTPDGRRPMSNLDAVTKGHNSRQEGLDAIAEMLHSTLAQEAPYHHYWDLEGYTEDHRMSFCEFSQLLFAPGTEDLFDELQAARYDERKGGDPTMSQPETTLDMMDDATDCVRYLIRRAGHLIRSLRRRRRLAA